MACVLVSAHMCVLMASEALRFSQERISNLSFHMEDGEICQITLLQAAAGGTSAVPALA